MHIDAFFIIKKRSDMVQKEGKPAVKLEVVGFGAGGERYEEEGEKAKRNVLNKIRKLEKYRNSKDKFEIYKGFDYLDIHYQIFQSSTNIFSPLQLPAYHRFDKPYWEVPRSDKSGVVLTTQLSDGLEIWAGPLIRLELGVRALLVDMAMRVYATELLKTATIAEQQIATEFPRSSQKTNAKWTEERQRLLDAQLLLAMMHSFRDEYVVALAFAHSQGEKHLVGSIGAVQGYTDRLVSQTIGVDETKPDLHASIVSEFPSSLPSNTALKYELNQRGRELAQVPEREVVEITRLNVVSKAICAELGVSSRAVISQALMYLIHEAVQQNFPTATQEIFNTHPELHRAIRQLGLPAEVISQEGTVQPTALFAESIHGHYFRRSTPIPQMMSVRDAVQVGREFYHLP
jgi:hypothetical protein